MKKLMVSLLLLSFQTLAAEGLTIANSFQVDQNGQVFRGREPKKLISELPAIGITDVIIFKNDVKGEVVKEMAGLKALNITTHHIPFRWRDYPSMTVACEQIVDALNIIQQVKANRGKVFFHCTAGEDRTGTLAGLYRMLEERISVKVAFEDEMCERGYSDGNKHKPALVIEAIEKELTPLFVALSRRVEKGEWQLGRLNKNSCLNLKLAPSKLRCSH